MKELYQQILQNIGEDPSRQGLLDTPKRASEAMKYLTKGYHDNLSSITNGALFESNMEEMIVVRNIELYSMCEHHLLPFFGQCHIGYLPKGRVLGLSKFARIVDVFARRLQIQERLNHEIAESIQSITDARGVAVVIEAQHLCMMMRGVEKQNSIMTTSSMLGDMRNNPSTRNEFLNLIKK